MALSPTEKRELLDELMAALVASPLHETTVETPLGVEVQCGFHVEVTIEVAPRSGAFVIRGVRSLNDVDEQIEIRRIVHGNRILLGNPFDSATYSLPPVKGCDLHGQLYWPVAWGTISQMNPLVITFACKGTPSVSPFLNWTLFGEQLPVDMPVPMPSLEGGCLPKPYGFGPPRAQTPTPVGFGRAVGELERNEKKPIKDDYPVLPRADMPNPQPWGILRDRRSRS